MSDKQKRIDPKSLRGRIAQRVIDVIGNAADDPGFMQDTAHSQGLTVQQLTAACITESVMEEIAKGK